MTQPPTGGYPPPDQSPPGGYPPPAQPGGYPPPGPSYAPPPNYTAPPAPSYPAPPLGGYAPPPAAGYPPPATGGYPPPPPGYGPPPAPGYGAPVSATGGGSTAIDFSKITVIGWGVIGAAFLTLIASFFNFWSVSAPSSALGYGYSVGLSGWNSWWWLPVLLAVAVGVLYALTLFGIIKTGPIKPEFLFYVASASFVLMIIVLIITFSYGGSVYDAGMAGISVGPGFGVWLALITTLALAYFSALSVQSKGGNLPFKVPGPTV